MIKEIGFKELYDVTLKATLPIEVGGVKIEAGETIAQFDKIQIANFQEIRQSVSANGGYGNRAQIIWDTTKELKISFIQGVFSKTQLALMTNTNLISNLGDEKILIHSRQVLETDNGGKIVIPRDVQKPVFVYDADTGEKLTNWQLSGNEIHVGPRYKPLIVDYWFFYNNGFKELQVGRPLTTSFLSLNGKMRVKDDTTGKVVTGIIKIPKLRLMSDLSIRVGSDAIPQVGRLDAVAVPEGGRGQQKIMEIIFLNDDIDADM